ncbi:MAG TPA: MFS transporter [Bacillales bacterium]
MGKKKSVFAFIVVVLGFLMALLDTTIVNITLPKMTEYFKTDLERISWVINGYNLAFAVLLLTAARLADQFGRKKIFLIGVALFVVSSYLSGISETVDWLIFFRVVQGLAAAFVVPVTIPLAVGLFPNNRGAVMGVWGAMAGLAAAGGPALGGFLSSSLHWQWIFFINVPVGIVTVTGAYFLLKESYDSSAGKKIDWGGISSLSAGMFALTLGLIQANDTGWTSAYILTLFAIAFISFVVFIQIELKSAEPMLPLWMLKIWPFSFGSATLFVVGVGLMCGSFLLAFFLTQMLGMSELEAGLTISAMPLVSMVFSAVCGPFSDKVGNRWFSTLGMVLFGIGIFSFSGLSADSTRVDVVWRLMIAGAGMGMTMAPTIGATVRAVPFDKVGISSGVTNMTRTIGMVLGVAVLVTLFNVYTEKQVTVAKDKAVSVVQSSKELNARAKKKMVQQLRKAEFTQQNQGPEQKDILQNINNAEKQTLASVPDGKKAAVKKRFEQQKKTVKRLWPKIRETFTGAVVDAFSATFKWGSLFVLMGAVFAFFSDPSRSGRKEVEQDVYNKKVEAN